MSDFSEKTCLFIGRFQPFHMGQMMVVEGMAKSCKKVIVGIGSSEEYDTKENPFSFDERREMIQRALQEKDMIVAYDVSIIAVPDVPEDAAWIDHVKETVGDFDAVWTGNPDVAKLCEEKGIEVKEVKEVPGISGSEIRQMMKDDDGFWDEKVLDSVAQYIKTIDGAERVRNLG